MAALEDVDVAGLRREELPAVLGKLVELEARVRLRLAEAPVSAAAPAESRMLDADEAAGVAGCSPRSLRARTRGMAFRRDWSRKVARFDEAGLRAWLGRRRT